MPNIKSAKKRVITSDKRNEINTAKKARVKTAIKKYYRSRRRRSCRTTPSRNRFRHRLRFQGRYLQKEHGCKKEIHSLPRFGRTQSKQVKNVLSQHFKRLFENSLFFVERNLRILSYASQLLPILFFLTRIVATTQTRQTPSAHIAEIDAIVSTPASSFSFSTTLKVVADVKYPPIFAFTK